MLERASRGLCVSGGGWRCGGEVVEGARGSYERRTQFPR